MKIRSSSFRRALRLMAPAVFMIFLHAAPARADDTDPFQLDSMQWMSFARYKDEVRHGKVYTPVPVKPARPAANAPNANGGKVDGLALAAPKRPLNTPPLPGVNDGFDLRVGSTAESGPPVARIAHMNGTPKLQLKQDWETTSEALQRLADDRKAELPIDIHMTLLPGIDDMTPVPGHVLAQSRGDRVDRDLAAAHPHAQDPNEADYAKWSTELNAYKKRQLEALQSDRRTLAALQTAIHQLGLQKKLDFMPGLNTSTLGPQADYAPQEKMDTPANPPKN